MHSGGKWLAEGTVLKIGKFLSKGEVRELKSIADQLFRIDHGPRWPEAAFNTAFLEGPKIKHLVTPTLLKVEDRVANITGIPLHRDETLMMFTRQRPGAMGDGYFVKNVHHDKNGAERRVVTFLMYLTTTAANADGGHTIFPQLHARKPLAEAAANREEDPIEYMAAAFEQAFRNGTYVLTLDEIAMQEAQRGRKGVGRWDIKALRFVQEECKRALSGRSRALAVRPRQGTAVVIWAVRPTDGLPNAQAWHCGCHARSGDPRYAMQKFKEPLEGQAMEDRHSEF